MADASEIIQGANKSQSPAHPQPPQKKRRVVKFVLLAILGLCLLLKIDSFIFGLYGYPPYLFTLLWVAAVPFTLFALIWLVIYKIAKRLTHSSQSRFAAALQVIVLLSLLYLVPLPSFSLMHRLGFRLWIQAQIDIPTLVQWTQTYVPPSNARPDEISSDTYTVPASALPEKARTLAELDWHKGTRWKGLRLGPQVSFHQRTRTIEFWFGGSLIGYWGCTVGKDAASRANSGDLRIGEDAYVFDAGD